MKTRIFYNKRTGEPVQIIARAQTKPTFQEVICYQELTKPFDHYVMEQVQFFAEYVNDFEGLPILNRKQISKKEDLPDKQPRISKGVVSAQDDDLQTESGSAVTSDPRIRKMIEFFDATSYFEKLKLFEGMKEELDEHMLNNIAVSLDLSIEKGMDGYRLILSELQIRSKYEGKRGDRL